METPPALIALDWGTTSLRAFLVAADGTAIARKASALGILNVPTGGFARVFAETADPWLAKHPNLPVLASGMIGSRQGWQEAPYVACPAGLDELAPRLLRVETDAAALLWIVPGVMRDAPGQAPDVMRGEETQILGALGDAAAGARRLFILPGTHSKWALVEAGRIVWFATFMTGEVYAVLRRHSILGRLMEGEAEDRHAFSRGLDAAAEAETGGLLHKLFTVRSLALFDRLSRESGAAYLSGLLIGSEIAEAQASLARLTGAAAGEATIIGGERLARLYGEALAQRGLAIRLAPEDAATRGILRIAAAAGVMS